MTEVLIHIPIIWLRKIVSDFARDGIGCKNRRALIELQRDVALQVN